MEEKVVVILVDGINMQSRVTLLSVEQIFYDMVELFIFAKSPEVIP